MRSVGVTSDPQHVQLELTPADELLLLASDGVWGERLCLCDALCCCCCGIDRTLLTCSANAHLMCRAEFISSEEAIAIVAAHEAAEDGCRAVCCAVACRGACADGCWNASRLLLPLLLTSAPLCTAACGLCTCAADGRGKAALAEGGGWRCGRHHRCRGPHAPPAAGPAAASQQRERRAAGLRKNGLSTERRACAGTAVRSTSCWRTGSGVHENDGGSGNGALDVQVMSGLGDESRLIERMSSL